MFSKLFARGLAPSPESSLNPQWKAKLSREAAGQPIIDLTNSNPTTSGIPNPANILSLFNRSTLLKYAPDPAGSFAARKAIANDYASRGQWVRAEELLLTSSTSEAYSFLFKLLCNPGDEILIPMPSYPLFDTLAELEHVNLIRYPLRLTTRWQADFGFLRNLISTRCKALILVNPNNPTGHLTDADEIKAYLALAEEYGLALIVDEVFCDYVLSVRPFQSMASNLPNESNSPLVFTLNGFSKMLGLPQLKLGWIHVGGNPERIKAALHHLEWIADAFLSVNTPVQEIAADLLQMRPSIQATIQKRLITNLSLCTHLVAEVNGVTILTPEAGWSVVLELDIPDEDDIFAANLVALHGVYVHPGCLFGFESGCFIVLSLLSTESDFSEGLKQILGYVAELRNVLMGLSNGIASHD